MFGFFQLVVFVVGKVFDDLSSSLDIFFLSVVIGDSRFLGESLGAML